MLTKICSFLIFITAVIKVFAQDNGTQIVNLNIGEIVFFQTPNYPALMNYSEFRSCCNMTFYLKNNTVKNYRLLVGISMAYNEIYHGLDYDASFLISNENVYTFELSDDYYISYAHQGFVLFENTVNTCPGESVSSQSPFKFNDETQIFYIQSNYYDYHKRNKSCDWKFAAPDGYGFKIVIKIFNVSSTTEFIVRNTTDIIVNTRSAKTFYPYYNSDNFIQISLSKSDGADSTEIEFQAYISVVKKGVEKAEGNCTITEMGNSIIWTNVDNADLDNNTGYKNNVFCTYDLIIPPGINYQISHNAFFERHMDYIVYYEDGFRKILPSDWNSPTFLFLLSNNNGTDKTVRFEFYSDGSVQSLGFAIMFTKYICECQNTKIICGQQFTILKDDIYFCGALNCSITIEPCQTKYGLINFLTIYDGKADEVDDYFKVISNGLTVFSFNTYNYEALKDYYIFVNSENENIFKIKTVDFPMSRSLTISMDPFDGVPVDLSVVLTADQPSHIIDTGVHTLTTIETSDTVNKKATFIWQSTESVFIYNNESLTQIVDNKVCLESCELQVRKFVLFHPESRYVYAVFAVRTAEPIKGCLFNKTIYTISSIEGDNEKISAIATEYGPCTITLLFTNFYYISSLWTNSKKYDVKLFIGTDKTRLYYKFNSYTSSDLTNIGLFSKSYQLEIPINASVFITIKGYPYDPSSSLYVDIREKDYKSIIATPHYAMSKLDPPQWQRSNFLIYNIKNEMALKFTILHYEMDDGDEFYFTKNNNNETKYFITDKSAPLIFTGNNVSMYCKYQPSRNINTGAVFFVESVPSKFPRHH